MRTNHLNKRKLAMLVGVSPVQVGRWISGETQPNVDIVGVSIISCHVRANMKKIFFAVRCERIDYIVIFK